MTLLTGSITIAAISMSDQTLTATTRTQKGRKTNALRASGGVPAVVYGSATQPQSIAVNRNQFAKMYKTAGESSIVELAVDGKDPLHVLIQDYQIDPLRGEVTHIDFRSIDMDKQIEAEIGLEFVGESPAVKALGGTLVLSRETVLVRCLPSKLVRSIEVNVGSLVTFDDVIRVSNLHTPEGMTVLEKPELAIALVQPPRSEAEMTALDAAVEENVAAVEGAGEKKVEETATPDAKEEKS